MSARTVAGLVKIRHSWPVPFEELFCEGISGFNTPDEIEVAIFDKSFNDTDAVFPFGWFVSTGGISEDLFLTSSGNFQLADFVAWRFKGGDLPAQFIPEGEKLRRQSWKRFREGNIMFRDIDLRTGPWAAMPDDLWKKLQREDLFKQRKTIAARKASRKDFPNIKVPPLYKPLPDWFVQDSFIEDAPFNSGRFTVVQHNTLFEVVETDEGPTVFTRNEFESVDDLKASMAVPENEIVVHHMKWLAEWERGSQSNERNVFDTQEEGWVFLTDVFESEIAGFEGIGYSLPNIWLDYFRRHLEG